ncbi:MAG: hypothetical protein V1782_02830, partial [Pseudomonadota bacterium]
MSVSITTAGNPPVSPAPGCRRACLWPVLALCLLLVLPGCSGSKDAKSKKSGKDKSQPVPVTVATG